jgi:hypothetical protein
MYGWNSSPRLLQNIARILEFPMVPQWYVQIFGNAYSFQVPRGR